MRGDFAEISETWKKQIRLLFIDGSHGYEDVKKDFSNWIKFLKPGGIVVFHDSLVWEDVNKFVKEVMSSGYFGDIYTIDSPGSLTYMTKLNRRINRDQLKGYLQNFEVLSKKRSLTKK